MKDFEYEPWHPSHEPKKFERTDRTGRYYVLEDTIEEISFGKLFLWLAAGWVLLWVVIGVTYFGAQ